MNRESDHRIGDNLNVMVATGSPRARPTKEPVMGPLTRQAMNVPLRGEPRRLLVLLAAYADAGERSPSARELSARMHCSVKRIDTLCRLLYREGLLSVRRRAERGTQRNVYKLRLGGLGDTGGESRRSGDRRR